MYTHMRDALVPEAFISLRRAAGRLGVPSAWLRNEAHAGRVPHLRIGRRLLFNVQAVELALLQRASEAAQEGHNGG